MSCDDDGKLRFKMLQMMIGNLGYTIQNIQKYTKQNNMIFRR